jgi:hypothetical protein
MVLQTLLKKLIHLIIHLLERGELQSNTHIIVVSTIVPPLSHKGKNQIERDVLNRCGKARHQ